MSGERTYNLIAPSAQDVAPEPSAFALHVAERIDYLGREFSDQAALAATQRVISVVRTLQDMGLDKTPRLSRRQQKRLAPVIDAMFAEALDPSQFLEQ